MWIGLLVRLYLHGTEKEETARLFKLNQKYLGPDNIKIKEILNEVGIDQFRIWSIENEHINIAACSDDIPTIILVEQVLMEHTRSVKEELNTFQHQRGLKLNNLFTSLVCLTRNHK